MGQILYWCVRMGGETSEKFNYADAHSKFESWCKKYPERYIELLEIRSILLEESTDARQ